MFHNNYTQNVTPTSTGILVAMLFLSIKANADIQPAKLKRQISTVSVTCKKGETWVPVIPVGSCNTNLVWQSQFHQSQIQVVMLILGLMT